MLWRAAMVTRAWLRRAVRGSSGPRLPPWVRAKIPLGKTSSRSSNSCLAASTIAGGGSPPVPHRRIRGQLSAARTKASAVAATVGRMAAM
jgi:hypothetical protein